MLLRLTSILVFLLASFGVQAQQIPRTSSGKPDLQGIWQTHNRAHFDLEDHAARHDMLPGRSVIEESTIPYLPAALAQKNHHFANRAQLDPVASCYLPGVPRIMMMPNPYHIFQTDEHVAIAFEWSHVFRKIPITDEADPYAGIEGWMGRSRGYWDGDTLVVEVNDFNGKTWLDAAGNHHSDALKVTERYTLIDADTIQYRATIEDPQVFSQPWTINVPLQRQKHLDRILEYPCQAEKEEFTGDFERDERTWYPAAIPADNVPFDYSAGGPLPPLEAGSDIRRLADGTPDISGYYMADAGGSNYGLEFKPRDFLTPASRGVVIDPPDGMLPYQTWARAERIDRELPHRGYDDPTAHCFVTAGVPRSHYVPSPFYILQPPGYVVILHERTSWRIIPLDGREHLPDSIRLWQGDSVGRWEGDVLVVESRNFNGKHWLNEVGDVISHMQTVVETFTPVSEYQVMYRATITDPIPYSRPWTMEMPFDRSDDELLEVACLEDDNDLQHLKDVRDAYRAEQQQ
jgi:hypothetical protein